MNGSTKIYRLGVITAIILTMAILLYPSVSAQVDYKDCSIYGTCKPISTITSPIISNGLSTNNTLCWQGLCGSPFDYFLTNLSEQRLDSRIDAERYSTDSQIAGLVSWTLWFQDVYNGAIDFYNGAIDFINQKLFSSSEFLFKGYGYGARGYGLVKYASNSSDVNSTLSIEVGKLVINASSYCTAQEGYTHGSEATTEQYCYQFSNSGDCASNSGDGCYWVDTGDNAILVNAQTGLISDAGNANLDPCTGTGYGITIGADGGTCGNFISLKLQGTNVSGGKHLVTIGQFVLTDAYLTCTDVCNLIDNIPSGYYWTCMDGYSQRGNIGCSTNDGWPGECFCLED